MARAEVLVVIASCSNLEKTDTGLFGQKAPDPYVVVLIDGQKKYQTEVLQKTTNPSWQAAYSLPTTGGSYTFSVWDKDENSTDDPLGDVTLTADQLLNLPSQSVHTLQRGGKKLQGTLTLTSEVKRGDLTWSPREASGKKKALMIGINYFNLPKGKGQLNGCINDVATMKKCIISHGYPPENIRVYTDDQPNAMPTRANILAGIKWLLEGVQTGDALFFHYSGHGGQVDDSNSEESDGKDETIIPVDYRENGQITDDDLYLAMCAPLPPGSRLTAVMDCCHSGTGMDLPYEHKAGGASRAEEISPGFKIAGALMDFGSKFLEKKSALLAALLRGGKPLILGFAPKVPSTHSGKLPYPDSKADIILFSGCRDDQTSADASIEGKYSGAMTYSFNKALLESSKLSYDGLLERMRTLIIEGRYTQVPQLSTGRPFDLNLPFAF